MPRRHLMRGFTAGKKGLRKVFSRNRTLRTTLGPKAREEALSTLRGFKSGGGITPKELKKSYGKWTRNTKDNITRAQAKVIRRELKEYANQSTRDKAEDTRSYLDQVRSGNTSRFSDTPKSLPGNYRSKMKDHQYDYQESAENSGFSQPDRPSNFDDEESDEPEEHQALF